MSSESGDVIEAESTITDSYGIMIPPEVRKALGKEIEPGDTVRWVVDDMVLSLEIIHERYGAFEDAEPFDGRDWDSEEAAESAWHQ